MLWKEGRERERERERESERERERAGPGSPLGGLFAEKKKKKKEKKKKRAPSEEKKEKQETKEKKEKKQWPFHLKLDITPVLILSQRAQIALGLEVQGGAVTAGGGGRP